MKKYAVGTIYILCIPILSCWLYWGDKIFESEGAMESISYYIVKSLSILLLAGIVPVLMIFVKKDRAN